MTENLSISSVSFMTHAQRTMQLNMALGILTANLSLRARIPTFLIDASLIIRAFLIPGAFRFWYDNICLSCAFNEWRSIISSWASANRLVVNSLADSVDTASIYARISAFLVDASTIERAIFVGDTFRI